VWLGTSVEDQRALDERVPLLLDTPAALRFLSCEPLLGPLDLRARSQEQRHLCIVCGEGPEAPHEHRDGYRTRGLDWVIVGGESGPGEMPDELDARRREARASVAAIEWFRSLRDQCCAAGVAYFQKQVGSRPMFELGDNEPWYASGMMLGDGGSFRRDANGLRLGFAVRTRDRKGADPAEWPEDLRIREFPEVPDGSS